MCLFSTKAVMQMFWVSKIWRQMLVYHDCVTFLIVRLSFVILSRLIDLVNSTVYRITNTHSQCGTATVQRTQSYNQLVSLAEMLGMLAPSNKSHL